MSQTDLYMIKYRLHGVPKSFIIRAKLMNNAEAWQWASCDAGLTPIPKPGRPPLKRFSKPMAERFGVPTCNGTNRRRCVGTRIWRYEKPAPPICPRAAQREKRRTCVPCAKLCRPGDLQCVSTSFNTPPRNNWRLFW